MRKTVFSVLFLIGFISLNAQVSIPVDGIIVVVGKDIIMRSDLENAYRDYAEQFNVVENPDELRCEILERLVMQKLFLHQADLDSIEVTSQQVEDQVNYRISYITQQVGGDPKVIEDFYNKPIEEIKKDLREIMKDQLIIDQVQQSITGNIAITPSEVKNFYEKVNYDSLPVVPASYEFGHIVKVPPVSEEEIIAVKKRLNEYRERILRGEKLSMLARLYSDDPGSAPKGGNLGFVERGTLYPEFEAVAFKLKSGEVSQIVQTKAGYHIIQMIERRGESINVAHILLQPKPSVEEQVKAIEYLDSVRKVILAQNISFSEAAMKFSDDLNKNSGGWVVNPYTASSKFDKESIDPTVFSSIDKLIPGEYSQPLPYVNEDGMMAYRLIYLKSKVAPHKPNLVEDYDVIQNAAMEEKRYKALDKWLINKVKFTSLKLNDEYKFCPFVEKWQIP